MFYHPVAEINNPMRAFIIFLILAGFTLAVSAQNNPFAATNDVAWTTPGTDENDSMPLGNGDIALNVWTEPTGDLVLLIAKSDAWSENGQLLKLGRVRIQLTPNPFVSSGGFTQTLRLESGDIQVCNGGNMARIWVDANHPVIHVEIQSTAPVQVTAISEVWRTRQVHLNQHAVSADGFFELSGDPDGLDFDPDILLPATNNEVSWCHFNARSIYPMVLEKEHLAPLLTKYPDPLLNRCFGVMMKGTGLVAEDNLTLKSTVAAKSFRLDLYALTQQTSNPAAWQSALNDQVKNVETVDLAALYEAHQAWWTDFWNRSWIHVTGTLAADQVSQSYAIQRFMTACAGRGAQPIKFNGSLFTVGHDLPAGVSSTMDNHDADYRGWGSSFWNQNERLIYWPLIASGDNDLLAPWFNMYVQALPMALDRTRLYFHHAGGAFIETINFWGLPNLQDFGWNNQGIELQSSWMRFHIQGGLEVLAQMLDRFEYTGDAAFVHDSVLPMADAVITYYDQHWPHDANGRIRMSPSQSIETYQVNAVNPTPDIAGLMSTLPRLLSLPNEMTTPAQRDLWSRVLRELPPLPMGTTAGGKLPPFGKGDPDGRPTILPAEHYGHTSNTENPELYTVFPYRLYDAGKPDLKLARDTFAARLFHFDVCWGQDGIEAALLGLTDEAKRVAVTEFTAFGNQRFPWFWRKNNDWIPDMDNGGAGMMTLQLMLLQCDGPQIRLIPAWPHDWTADFKLHAPNQTTVEAHVEKGKVTQLVVTPTSRSNDVIITTPDTN
jgi:alpha-L-fucosidase 2